MSSGRVINGTAGMLALVVLVGLSGCASKTAPQWSTDSARTASPAATEQVAPGDIPDTQAFVEAKAPSGRWAMKVPEGWSERTLAAGFVFTDKLNSIQAVERAAAQAPTIASVRAQEVPRLESAPISATVSKVAAFNRAGGAGVMIAYQADSAKDAVTGKVHRDAFEEYLFSGHGREVVVTLSGAVGADNVDPWRTVTDSFRWLR